MVDRSSALRIYICHLLLLLLLFLLPFLPFLPHLGSGCSQVQGYVGLCGEDCQARGIQSVSCQQVAWVLCHEVYIIIYIYTWSHSVGCACVHAVIDGCTLRVIPPAHAGLSLPYCIRILKGVYRDLNLEFVTINCFCQSLQQENAIKL